MASAPSVPWSHKLNPIFVRCVRSRLRTKHMLTWGLITATVTLFFFLVAYLGASERGHFTVMMAARVTLLPIIGIQAFILMLLGTGAVASGIALEKDSGILDFHRMTPMSITAKLLGYLLGLPIRQYYMFALTLPFLIFAVIAGKVPILKVLHFYVIFFSSVLLYHLTGLVAGMLAARPRRANWIAQAMVVALYLILPQFGRLGFSSFSYLTIMPTFRSLFFEFLPERIFAGGPFAFGGYDVPFFTAEIHPSIYTIVMQAFVSITLITVVWRKWRDDAAPAFSKPYAMIFYFVLTMLLVGSLWPFWTGRVERGPGFLSASNSVQVFFVLCLFAAAFLLHVVTPTADRYLRGLRWSRKARLERIPFYRDAAPSFWVALGFIGITTAAFLALVAGAQASDAPTSFVRALLLPALFATVILYVHGARAAFSARGFFMVLFGVWLIPVLTVAVIAAAAGLNQASVMLGSISPLVAFQFVSSWAVGVGDAAANYLRRGLDLQALSITALLVSGLLAAGFQYLARRTKQRIDDLHATGAAVVPAAGPVAAAASAEAAKVPPA